MSGRDDEDAPIEGLPTSSPVDAVPGTPGASDADEGHDDNTPDDTRAEEDPLSPDTASPDPDLTQP